MNSQVRKKLSLFFAVCLIFYSVVGAAIQDEGFIGPQETKITDSSVSQPYIKASHSSGVVKKGTSVSFTTTTSAILYVAQNEEGLTEETLIKDENLYQGPIKINESTSMSVIAVDVNDDTLRSEIETYTYTVQDSDLLTIEEVKEHILAEESSPVKTTGIVTWVFGNEAIIQDDTSGIAFIFDQTENTPSLGDELTISGKGVLHNGLNTIENAQILSIDSTDNNLPDPEEVTASELKSDFKTYEGKRIILRDVTLGKYRGAGVTQLEADSEMFFAGHAPIYPDGVIENSVVDVVAVASIYDKYHTKNYHLLIASSEDYLSTGSTIKPQVEKVTADPESGQVEDGQKIQLFCETEGVTFEYSTDKKDWITLSEDKLVISKTAATYYVRAKKDGYKNSKVTTLNYIIEGMQPSEELLKISEVLQKESSETELLKTQGVVTYVFGNQVTIEDETKGIKLILTSDQETLKIGDQVIVAGYKGTFRGLNVLQGVNVLNKTNGIVLKEPEEITVSELKANFEQYESKRVKLVQVTLGKHRGAGLTQVTGDDGVVYVDHAPAYPDGVIEGSRVDLIGIASIYDEYQTKNYHLQVASSKDYMSTGSVKPQIGKLTASPESGSVVAGQKIQLSCETPEVTFEYSTDKTKWTTVSKDTFQIIKGIDTYYVRANKAGYLQSPVLTLKYTLSDTQKLYTIAEVLQGENLEAQEVMTQGIVTYVFGNKVVIQDHTGGIELALDPTNERQLVVGNNITVSGYKSVYNGVKILNTAKVITVNEEKGLLPEPKVVTIQELQDNLEKYSSQRVKLMNVTAGKYRGAGSTVFTQNGSSIYVSHAPQYPQGAGEGSIMEITGVATYYKNYGTTTCRLYIGDTSDYKLISADNTPSHKPSNKPSHKPSNKPNQQPSTPPEQNENKPELKDDRLNIKAEELELTAAQLQDIIKNLEATHKTALYFEFKEGSLKIGTENLKAFAADDKKINIAVKESATGQLEVKVLLDDKEISQLPKGTVLIFNHNASAFTVPVTIGKDGSEKIIIQSQYEDGKVTALITETGTFTLKDNEKTFKDITNNHWGKEAIHFAASREIFKGDHNGNFKPSEKLSRAMFVTVLSRLENEALESKSIKFNDVKADSWYTDAVAWAVENKVANGVSDKEFKPDKAVTRGELITMLYNYVARDEKPVVDQTILNQYGDANQIPAYSRQALAWAAQEGLIKGNASLEIMPFSEATRAEAAAIMERFIKAQVNE